MMTNGFKSKTQVSEYVKGFPLPTNAKRPRHHSSGDGAQEEVVEFGGTRECRRREGSAQAHGEGSFGGNIFHTLDDLNLSVSRLARARLVNWLWSSGMLSSLMD